MTRLKTALFASAILPGMLAPGLAAGLPRAALDRPLDLVRVQDAPAECGPGTGVECPSGAEEQLRKRKENRERGQGEGAPRRDRAEEAPPLPEEASPTAEERRRQRAEERRRDRQEQPAESELQQQLQQEQGQGQADEQQRRREERRERRAEERRQQEQQRQAEEQQQQQAEEEQRRQAEEQQRLADELLREQQQQEQQQAEEEQRRQADEQQRLADELLREQQQQEQQQAEEEQRQAEEEQQRRRQERRERRAGERQQQEDERLQAEELLRQRQQEQERQAEELRLSEEEQRRRAEELEAEQQRLEQQQRRAERREGRPDEARRERIEQLREQRRERRERIESIRDQAREEGRQETLQDLREQRRERRIDGRLVIEEGDGRVIVTRRNGDVIIRNDESERLRENAREVDVTRLAGGFQEVVVTRPNGVRVITLRDPQDRVIRRTRVMPNGQRYVLFSNEPGSWDRPEDFIVSLPPPVITIPQDRYIVEAETAAPEVIYETFAAPLVQPVERGYTLDQVVNSQDLLDRVRRVDIDSITFETGSWRVDESQIEALDAIAESVLQMIDENPDEVFLIEGHTDAVGSDLDNLTLSDRRAEEIAYLLTEYYDVPAENLTTKGYGERYLKVPTEGPSRENRRVTMRRITPLLETADVR